MEKKLTKKQLEEMALMKAIDAGNKETLKVHKQRVKSQKAKKK